MTADEYRQNLFSTMLTGADVISRDYVLSGDTIPREPGSHGLFREEEGEQTHKDPSLTMSLSKSNPFLTWFLSFVLNICVVLSNDGGKFNLLAPPEKLKEVSLLSRPVADANKSAADYIFSLNLLSFFTEDREISDYCSELLQIFGQRYAAYVNCLVPAARPVKVCQGCFASFGSLQDIYMNISSDQVRVTYKGISCFIKRLSLFSNGKGLPLCVSCLMITSFVTCPTFEEIVIIFLNSFRRRALKYLSVCLCRRM